MTAVLLRDPPEFLQAWLKDRQALGQDGYDEVYHVVPVAHGRQGRTQAELTVAMRPAAFRESSPGDSSRPERAGSSG